MTDMKSATYRSPLRAAQSAGTTERILAAAATVMQARGHLAYAAVAAEAGVQERTVYRHFRTKQDLETGLWRWIVANLTGADFSATSEDELVNSMTSSFRGFDAGAPLIEAMLHSPQGR